MSTKPQSREPVWVLSDSDSPHSWEVPTGSRPVGGGRPRVLKLGSAPGWGLQGRHQGPLSEAHPPCPHPLQLAMGKMMEQGPVLIITFQAQMVMVIKNPKGEVVEGDPVSGQEGRGRACTEFPALQGTRTAP